MAIITRREAAGIIQLSIDQPNSPINELSAAFWQELSTELTDIATDPPLRGVMIVSSKPNHFAVGLALDEIGTLIGNAKAVNDYMNLGHAVLTQLETLPCPSVAMIDGPCTGAGVELALACDYRVLSLTPEMKLGFPEIALGLMPGFGGTQRLARLVGVQTAIERLLSGIPYSESDLPEEDLVDELAPPEEIIAVAAQMLDVGDGYAAREIKLAPVDEDYLPSSEFLETIPTLLETLRPEVLATGVEIVRVIMEGSLKSFAEGQQLEADAFAKLLGTETFRSQFDRLSREQRKG